MLGGRSQVLASRRARRRVCVPVLLCLLGAAPVGHAQEQSSVVFDDTPGFGGAGEAPWEEANGGKHFAVDYCSGCTESHGMLVGSGLFQSLLELRIVESTDSVTFSATFPDPMSAPPIDYVFVRVTGDETTPMNGTLVSTIEGADFFLFNPRGVMFGADSTLETRGSFYASTANELRFSTDELTAAQGPKFEARPGGAVPTIDANPAEFGFLQELGAPAPIQVAGDQLSVPAGETLSFIGGSIDVKGRVDSQRDTIRANDGMVVQFAAVSAGADVPLDIRGFDAGNDPNALVRLSQNTRIQINGSGPGAAGRIVIRGGRFEAVRGGATSSALMHVESAGEGSNSIDIAVGGELYAEAATFESVMGFRGPSGDISLSGENVVLARNTTVQGRIGLGALAAQPGPNIVIGADTLRVEDGSSIRTEDDLGFGRATGKVGDITISANKVELSGQDSGIFTRSHGTGAGGKIDVSALEVDLRDDAQIVSNRIRSTVRVDVAAPGAIEINADKITVADGAQILSETSNFVTPGGTEYIGTSDGSPISIGSAAAPIGELLLSGGAIGSVTHADAVGGAVTVHAVDIMLQRSLARPAATPQISALTGPDSNGLDGAGAGGPLEVWADSIELRDGSQLRAETVGNGNGGSLNVIVAGMLLASGAVDVGGGESSPSGVFARSSMGATGNGGNLTIEAGVLTLEDGAEISARTFTAGNAGSLTITTGDLTVGGSEGGRVSTISTRGAEGDGGALEINADRIQIRNGGIVSASTTGSGAAGDLTIVARELDVSGNGTGIFAQSRSGESNAGVAGSISISAPDGEQVVVRVTDGATISVEATAAEAGTLTIESASLVRVASGGSITAGVSDVPGQNPGRSNIEMTLTRIELDNGSITSRTDGTGPGGGITLIADEISISNGSTISAESSAIATGDAGDIVIVANDTFEVNSSTIITTAENGGGGRISIQADQLVSIFDTTIETSVLGANAASDAGDINIPLPNSGAGSLARVVPRFVVINKSTIIADATAADAGNITIAGKDVLISADSLIRAHSEQGVSGDIEVTSPDADIVSQVTALPSSFVDPSDRLLPPCVARTERTGSFTVQKRKAVLRSPDAPLSPETEKPSLDEPGAAPRPGDRVFQFRDPARCFVPEESS